MPTSPSIRGDQLWAMIATSARLGGMYIRREGLDASLPPVLIGNPLDTQAAGGGLDCGKEMLVPEGRFELPTPQFSIVCSTN